MGQIQVQRRACASRLHQYASSTRHLSWGSLKAAFSRQQRCLPSNLGLGSGRRVARMGMGRQKPDRSREAAICWPNH